VADERLARLARSIDALAKKDEELARRTREIAELRRKAAGELHAVCSYFVTTLNALIREVKLELSPAEFSPENFREAGANLFLINARGRVVQIEFRATEQLTSTERFRTAYTLEGAIRWYNQEMLERIEVPEHAIVYVLDKQGGSWRYIDARTQKAGGLDTSFLAGLMERLV
jgi:hypothetical protein